MSKKLFNFCQKVIENTFLLLFFLVPLILTPWNSELFEFNKMLLTYFLTAVIVCAWFFKMVLGHRIIWRKTFMDIPLLFFLFSQSISTVFSLDWHTSIWGYYSRFNGGLLSLVSYCLLFWAFVSNFESKKIPRLIGSILTSSFLVAGYGIAEHFGIDAGFWVQDVKSRVFSTLGQPNWLAAYLDVVIFLPLGLAFSKKTNWPKLWNLKKAFEFIPYFLFATIYLCLLYTKSRSGILAFLAAYLIFGAVNFFWKRRGKQNKKMLFAFSGIVLVLSLIIQNPVRDKFFSFNQKTASESPLPPGINISESADIRKVVWKGALAIGRNFPFFGSGPETFAYSYYRFRPVEHNLLSEWDFLYNKAHNEYLNYFATCGILGLGTYLGIILFFLFWALRQIIKNQNSYEFPLLACLFCGWISTLITNFFGFSVVIINLLFFLVPAIFLLFINKKEKIIFIFEKKTFKEKILLFLIFAGLIFIFINLGKIWYSDHLFDEASKYLEKGDYKKAVDFAKRASLDNPKELVYHDKLSIAAATLAQWQWDKNEKDLALSSAELAKEESKKAISANPYNVNFWKNRMRVFVKLSEIDPNYKLNALETLVFASSLAPTDAKIFYNLALAYGQVGQDQIAIETLKKTVQLKANYQEAHYALALYLKQAGNKEEAISQLEYILEKINPNDEGIKKLLEDWKK